MLISQYACSSGTLQQTCYYFEDNDSTDSNEMKKHRHMSREISNYIMYLVFRSGVMLTTNSQYVHEKAHDEISTLLSGQDQQGQQVTTLQKKAAVIKLFQAKKQNDVQQDLSAPAVDADKAAAADRFKQKLLQKAQELDSPERAAVMKLFQGKKKEEQQDQSGLDTEKHEESVDNDSAADTHHLQSAQDLYSPVLPRTCEVAQELISIDDDTERWDLIASVWSEMLFFTAPCCGAAFHYEHLSIGGKLITHTYSIYYAAWRDAPLLHRARPS